MNPARDKGLPPYAYVPRGPWPHPASSPDGHSSRRVRGPAAPIAGERWAESPEYSRGVALFNAGYYWEAHEEWEALWHAHGRRGATADVLRGLIKLAAAGVKVRERQRHGVVTHARRAHAHFESARIDAGRRQLGLDLVEAGTAALRIADDPPQDPGQPGDPVARVFDFRIEPRGLDDARPCFPPRDDPAAP